MIAIITATSGEDCVIGVDGGLPWDVPEDRKFFKDLTTGHMVLMGRKTYESIGDGRLKNRKVVVVSSQSDLPYEYADVVDHPEKAIYLAKEAGLNLFVAGGTQVYAHMLPHADRIYWTKIEPAHEGDTVFPGIKAEDWEEVSSRVLTESPLKATVYAYKRRG